ncbi:thioredoxin-2 [Nematostella vectensis]|uniref:thioredoxin-2 n=1 Tax=Nematostella vectensis TaxID=45351 RepID=UPI0013902B73|nr:thioredoxin-2 [Nematostella vectensis]
MQRLKSKEDYEDFLKKTTGVAVIFFSAAWNGPSRGFTPKLQEISEEFDDVAFANVDVDENNAVATKEGVQMLPAFCYYKGGKKVGKSTGGDVAKVRKGIVNVKAMEGL